MPSRLKVPKKRKAERVNLAPHILGLFVGLGCPSDEDELDEALMDLLYFVVDVMQFHGEHNAYDEIDFDLVSSCPARRDVKDMAHDLPRLLLKLRMPSDLITTAFPLNVQIDQTRIRS